MKEQRPERSERKTCSKNQPYDGHGRWIHPDARFLCSTNDGIDEYDVYRCPNCNLTFKTIVPQ